MSRFTPRRSRDVALGIMAGVRARTTLTDIRDTDPLAQISTQHGNQLGYSDLQIARLELLYSLDDLSGEELDLRAAQILPDGLLRGGPKRAQGQLEFVRESIVGALVVSKGARGSTTVAGRVVYFASLADVTILAGNLASPAVAAACTETGTIGNLESVGMIDRLGSSSPGLVSVTNVTRFTNGSDSAGDPEFRDVIRRHILGLGRHHDDGILGRVIGTVIDDKTIRHAKMAELPTYAVGGTMVHMPLYVDDGAGTLGTLSAVEAGANLVAAAVGGERVLQLPAFPLKTAPAITQIPAPANPAVIFPTTGKVLLDAPLGVGDSVAFAAYEAYTGVLAEAQKRIDGDPSDRETYPQYRAASAAFLAIVPATVQWVGTPAVPLEITVVVSDYGIRNVGVAVVQANVKAAILAVINGLGIGDALLVSDLIAAAKPVPGVRDVDMGSLSNTYVLETVVLRTTLDRLGVAYGT